MTENEISNTIIGAVMKVHKALCPGLLGSAYQECLLYVLLKEGLIICRSAPFMVFTNSSALLAANTGLLLTKASLSL